MPTDSCVQQPIERTSRPRADEFARQGGHGPRPIGIDTIRIHGLYPGAGADCASNNRPGNSPRHLKGRLSVGRWSARASCVGRLPVCGLLLTAILAAPRPVGAEDKRPPREDKLKFHDAGGKTEFSLKLKDDGAKLVDGNEQELARYTRSGKKIKIKDAADKTLGYVVATPDKLRLESADEKTVLCTLRRQPDGDWKVLDDQEQRIGTIKRRDYGSEIEGAAEKSLYKVKVKEGKTSLRDAADKTRHSTTGAVSAPAMSCLGLDSVSDLRLRAGLMFAVDHGLPK